MASIIQKLLSLGGFIGSTPAAATLVPPDPNRALELWQQSEQVENPDVWSSYNSAMTRPRTFEEQLRLWDEMSHWDLMAAALSEIADEATQPDETSPGLIWFESNDEKAEEEANQMLRDIGADNEIKSQVWHVSGFGNNYNKLDYAPGAGVVGMSYIHPFDVRRFWLKRNRHCVGFHWKGNEPDKDSIFKLGNLQIQRHALNLGGSERNQVLQHLFYPWDILHIRHQQRNRQTEHGEPIFEEAQGIYKKIRLALDMISVLRAQVQPDRYVVNVDVKDLPPIDQQKLVNRWKHTLRTKLSFGSGVSGIAGQPDDFKAFYNATALDTILWIARPRDFSHSIEKIAGTTAIPDVSDVEMMINIFFSIIGMPKSWIGLGDSGKEGGPVSGKALLAQDMRFLRKIRSIRQPVISSYTWLGYFHLLLKGYDISNVDLKAKMTPIGSLEDTLKVELLAKQLEILDKLSDIMPKFGMPKEAWVELVFKKYLHLPDELVAAALTSLPPETKPDESVKREAASNERLQEMLRHRNQRRVSSRLQRLAMEEVIKKVGPERDSILGDIGDILQGESPRRHRRYRNAESVLRPAVLQEGDLVIQGLGSWDPTTPPPVIPSGMNVTESFTSHPGYRQALGAHLSRYQQYS